jgi:hypothetical protein
MASGHQSKLDSALRFFLPLLTGMALVLVAILAASGGISARVGAVFVEQQMLGMCTFTFVSCLHLICIDPLSYL